MGKKEEVGRGCCGRKSTGEEQEFRVRMVSQFLFSRVAGVADVLQKIP